MQELTPTIFIGIYCNVSASLLYLSPASTDIALISTLPSAPIVASCVVLYLNPLSLSPN